MLGYGEYWSAVSVNYGVYVVLRQCSDSCIMIQYPYT